MAGSQEIGITILLGLRGHEVGKVMEREGRIVVEIRTEQDHPFCPYDSLRKLYRHGPVKTLL